MRYVSDTNAIVSHSLEGTQLSRGVYLVFPSPVPSHLGEMDLYFSLVFVSRNPTGRD
jgi:hypothetical protein